MTAPAIRADPARTALVIVDMQNDFCHPSGYYAGAGRDISALHATIGPVRRLRDRAHDAAVPVVFTRLLHDTARGPMERRHDLVPRRWTASGRRLEPGSWGADIVADLTPRPDELVVDKAGYSAFDGTGLERWLRERQIKTLLLAGVVGYACVLATGFAAFDRDFDVLLVSDAVGSWEPELGRSALSIADLLLGCAAPADEIVFESHRGTGAPVPPG
ncbi:cysteine hydrolase family protein [Micromonospora sp. NPDC005299]|uniref:cysteine hydrolase family protein n=1 Tax=Micromonospora sp. NPDC005299 TaxID=3364231 RepID=UPI00369AB506